MLRVNLLLHEIAITEINKKYNENKKKIKNKEIIIIIIKKYITRFAFVRVVISSCSTPYPRDKNTSNIFHPWVTLRPARADLEAGIGSGG